MNTTVKIIEHPAGTHRVRIVQRQAGHYGFESEELRHVYEDSDDLRERYPNEFVWVPTGDGSFAILATAEDAEREARSRVMWLRSALGPQTEELRLSRRGLLCPNKETSRPCSRLAAKGPQADSIPWDLPRPSRLPYPAGIRVVSKDVFDVEVQVLL